MSNCDECKDGCRPECRQARLSTGKYLTDDQNVLCTIVQSTQGGLSTGILYYITEYLHIALAAYIEVYQVNIH